MMKRTADRRRRRKVAEGSDFELYSEKNVWSQQNKIWKKYFVKRPRLPEPGETMEGSSRWNDQPKFMPNMLGMFLGTHNEIIIKTLRNYREMFDENKVLPDCLIIHGSSGSGKSSIARAFIREMGDGMGLNSTTLGKWVFTANAKDYSRDYNILWNRISKYNESPIDRSVPVMYRIIYVDNADMIPPSNQQQLKKIMETSFLKCRFIFACQDATKMIGFVQQRATVVKTKSPNEKVALNIVLNILQRNKIGHELDGIQEIFNSIAPEISISKIIDLSQRVFLARDYVSRENVLRVIHNASTSQLTYLMKPEISSKSSIEPLVRCTICTLIPPCRHISLEQLNVEGLQRRQELPRYKGGIVCPEFLRYGHCSIFNKHGRCSLDHPKDIHIIVDPKVRCPICTIPWPCLHCKYSTSRLEYLKLIKDLDERIRRLELLLVPDPPIKSVEYLDAFHENWKSTLHQISVIFLSEGNISALQEAHQWVEDSLCTDIEEYESRFRVLKRGFGELARSVLLEDLTQRVNDYQKHLQQSQDGNSMSGDNDNGRGSHGMDGDDNEDNEDDDQSSLLDEDASVTSLESK